MIWRHRHDDQVGTALLGLIAGVLIVGFILWMLDWPTVCRNFR
jgi:hypothetical protein